MVSPVDVCPGYTMHRAGAQFALGKVRASVLGAGMPGEILTFEALLPRLARHARLIGIDPGTKTIGLALSDVERRIASPLETITKVKFSLDAARLLELVAQHQVAALVIGLPFNMDGSEGPRAQATRAFARNLSRLGAPPIVFQDERLSTVAVTRTLIEQDFSRSRRAAMVDKMAAAHILQGGLDRLAFLGAAHARLVL